uniref:GMC family oxidoreductase n=1 Tax=Orrella sp. TaxID=1921583 RepID=UPI0040485770
MSVVHESDVVIVGSGVAAALLAAQLVRAGIGVTIIEAGQSVQRAQAVKTFWRSAVKVPECAYEQTPYAMFPRTDEIDKWYEQAGPQIFKSTYLKVVGGTTWHWLGTCVRLLPSDFRLKTLFNRGVDWPIDYATLEPYYAKAEQEIGVAGNSDQDLGSPRSSAYPMDAIAQTYSDQVISKALANSEYEVSATPQGRNSVDRASRPACCGSASCIPVCPIQAKYDATVHLRQAVSLGAKLHERTTAVRLELDETGAIKGIRCRRWDLSEVTFFAKHYVLACHAIETPRLLLASRSANLPMGVSNRSDQVGRNLMDHPIQVSWAMSRDPLYQYRGPLSTSGIENLRDGNVRCSRSALRIEIGNDGWNWPTGGVPTTARDLISQGLRDKPLGQAIATQAARQLRLAALTEQLPDSDNRVTLDPTATDIYGVPKPKLHYDLDEYVLEGLKAATHEHEKIFGLLQATGIMHMPTYQGAGHIMGTVRMGIDPQSSVVDADLRSHDHPNLWMVGSGVFPTGGTANPTLTIAALSLRLAAKLVGQLT